MQRTKRANGRLVIKGNTAAGRCLRELLTDYGRGLEHLRDEGTRGLIHSAAKLALEVERLEDASDRGEIVDLEIMNRLINNRRRHLEKLDTLRKRIAPPAAEHQASGWSSPLRRHLHWLEWSDGRSGSREALLAEYSQREARGEFAAEVS
jgi:hypothetical protein